MEPLIFKIETQADDSGVRQYDKSLGGLDVSSKKASGALKNFVHDISQAKDGADIASSALGAFSKILGSSIAGTAIIIAGKTLIDSFNKINQAVQRLGESLAREQRQQQEAMAQMQQKQLQDAMQMQVDDVKGKLQAEYAVKIAKVQADAQIDRAASDAKIAIKSEEARQRMALRDAQTAQRLRAQSERNRLNAQKKSLA